MNKLLDSEIIWVDLLADSLAILQNFREIFLEDVIDFTTEWIDHWSDLTEYSCICLKMSFLDNSEKENKRTAVTLSPNKNFWSPK